MDIYSEIKNILQELCQTEGTPAFHLAKVKNVNGQTCTITIGELEISDVRLRSVVNNDTTGMLLTPKEGSFVMVTDLSNGKKSDWAVVMYSELEKIETKIGQMEISLSGEKISVKKGSINLFDLLDGLLTQILALTVPTGTGPSGTPVNASEFTQIKTKLGQIME